MSVIWNNSIFVLASLLAVLPLSAQNSVGLSCPAQAVPGGSVTCSLVLSLAAGVTVDSLTFGAAVTPTPPAPALTQGQLTFSDFIGGGFSSPGNTSNAISVVWFNLASPLVGTVPMCSTSFTIPANAEIGQTYLVTITGASTSRSENVVSLAIGPPAAISLVAAVPLTVNPNIGVQGQSLASVAITGQNTSFIAGTTVAGFGAGITVNSLTINSSTGATASIAIAGNAALGPRTVTMTTGGEVAVLSSGFTVLPGPCDVTRDPVISVADVQQMINEVLGTAPPLNGFHNNGTVTVVDVQVVLNAALGMGCVL